MRASKLTRFHFFFKALSALRESLYKILNETNKIDSSMSDLHYGSIIRKKLNTLNNYLDTWKYDFIKNVKSKYDKAKLQPIRHLEKQFTQEILDAVRPKRLHVLCKGEKFDKIQSGRRNKRNFSYFFF